MVSDSDLYNADELIAPDWLNAEFFARIVECKEGAKGVIKQESFAITPGTTKSDHYASTMFRAIVKYTLDGSAKELSMVIKTMPMGEGAKKETLGTMQIFETEIRMYAEALPRIEAILRKYGDQTKLGAAVLFHSLEPHKCIIFEDLVVQGYTAVNGRFCSMAEVKKALLKLAKLHAVSYMLGQQGDSSVTHFEAGFFNTIDVDNFGLIRDAVKLFKEVAAQHADLAAFVPLATAVEGSIVDKCIGSFNAYSNGRRDGIMVLSHGDFHMKNLMVHSVAGQLRDLMLVDYQLSVFGSPAIDVIYSSIMLLSPEMRHTHRDELDYYYFTNFQRTLELIEYDGHIPTMIEFQVELLRHSHWELFLTVAFLFFNYLFADAEGDLMQAVEDENYRRKSFNNPAILAEWRTLLPRYLHRGYFEASKSN